MNKTNFFFWGIVDEQQAEEMWKVLHDHFKSLEESSGGNDDGNETFFGKAVEKK